MCGIEWLFEESNYLQNDLTEVDVMLALDVFNARKAPDRPPETSGLLGRIRFGPVRHQTIQ